MPMLHQRHCLLSLMLPRTAHFHTFWGGSYTRDKSHSSLMGSENTKQFTMFLLLKITSMSTPTFPAHCKSSFPSSWVNKLKIVKPHRLNHLRNSTKWNLSFGQKYQIWASVLYCGSKSSLC